MACESCNTKSKIIFAVAAVFGLVGVILFIVALTSGSASTKVGFVVENKQDSAFNIAEGGELGFDVHIKASDHGDCSGKQGSTQLTLPDGRTQGIQNRCYDAQSDWESNNDPPLRKMGHFNPLGTYGEYRITSPAHLWVVDVGKELGEAVGGILAAIGIFVVGIIFVVISLILLCVGCCCLGNDKPSQVVVIQGGGHPPQVVGQPQQMKD